MVKNLILGSLSFFSVVGLSEVVKATPPCCSIPWPTVDTDVDDTIAPYQISKPSWDNTGSTNYANYVAGITSIGTDWATWNLAAAHCWDNTSPCYIDIRQLTDQEKFFITTQCDYTLGTYLDLLDPHNTPAGPQSPFSIYPYTPVPGYHVPGTDYVVGLEPPHGSPSSYPGDPLLIFGASDGFTCTSNFSSCASDPFFHAPSQTITPWGNSPCMSDLAYQFHYLGEACGAGLFWLMNPSNWVSVPPPSHFPPRRSQYEHTLYVYTHGSHPTSPSDTALWDNTTIADANDIYNTRIQDYIDFIELLKINENASWGLPPCTADWNSNGGITGEDLSDFYDSWENGNADVNMDGATTGDDVSAFYDVWENNVCF